MLNFKGQDILSTYSMSRKEMEIIFETADRLEPVARKRRNIDLLKDKTLAILFYQTSTRTRLSFEGAMCRLGGKITGFADPKVTRSTDSSYGEIMKDAIKVINMYSDVIAVRHPESGAAEEIANYAEIPVLNGGDGKNEHPTQALLDLYTIRYFFGGLEDLHVVLVGDMTVRTMHSLPFCLARYDSLKITVVHPDHADFQPEIKKKLENVNLNYQRAESVDEVVEDADVIYLNGVSHPEDMTEVQSSSENEDYYKIDEKSLEKAKTNMIVLHPLPRNDEVATTIDDTFHAKYYEQAYLGLVLRMALLTLVLGREEEIDNYL